jgi:hypothetical protein
MSRAWRQTATAWRGVNCSHDQRGVRRAGRALRTPEDPFTADNAAGALTRVVTPDALPVLRARRRKWHAKRFASIAALRRHVIRLVREFAHAARDSFRRHEAMQLLLMIAYWAEELYALEETLPATARHRGTDGDRQARGDVVAGLWASFDRWTAHGMQVDASELLHATDALVLHELDCAARRGSSNAVSR